jgi:hypothetical protein
LRRGCSPTLAACSGSATRRCPARSTSPRTISPFCPSSSRSAACCSRSSRSPRSTASRRRPPSRSSPREGVAYHFSALRQGQVYRVLEQLWGAAMARVLRRAERSSAIIEAQWARDQRGKRTGAQGSIIADSLERSQSDLDLAGSAAAAVSTMLDSVEFDFDEADGNAAELVSTSRRRRQRRWHRRGVVEHHARVAGARAPPVELCAHVPPAQGRAARRLLSASRAWRCGAST